MRPVAALISGGRIGGSFLLPIFMKKSARGTPLADFFLLNAAQFDGVEGDFEGSKLRGSVDVWVSERLAGTR